jgi:chorismate synthase|tara:strand:- start:18083 stop:19141 length:1059 start_codon:yes stop_codon:yes gene_type:complete
MTNTFGKLFSFTSFGESHGPAIGCVIDGCPPLIEIEEQDIQKDLDRRRPGTSKFVTQRNEPDKVKILSGIFEGKTTGTPIALLIENQDQKSKDYSDIKDKFRPSHADYTYFKKYGIRDYRGGGRSSARETAVRVAAGAVAKKFLKKHNIEITGYISQIGSIKIDKNNINYNQISKNDFFCPDINKVTELEDYLTKIKKEGDSIGAIIEIVAKNVPAGLGEPVYNKLDTALAAAMMSINAVKAVEIGSGFDVATKRGSEVSDEISMDGNEVSFSNNNSGGILGGISSGQDIIIRFAVKPTSSILKEKNTIDKFGNNTTLITKGRHDPCVGIRAVPIGEAMAACVLLDHFLLKK